MNREIVSSGSQALNPIGSPEVHHVEQEANFPENDSVHETPTSTREENVDSTIAESNRVPPQSPSVREIHKNSWLKKMPSAEKWSGRFSKAQKPEKFWVVFCVHDDKEAFLEFYENRRSAYSHKPLSNVSLTHCLHISPTIVVQENDHEFVITLDTQVIRLAASTRDQMLEWMDTMKTKLREIGVLEPKDNLYSKEPITMPLASQNTNEVQQATESQAIDLSRISLRDPNSPLPPVPLRHGGERVSSVSSSAIVYVRNPTALSTSQNPNSNSNVLLDSRNSHQNGERIQQQSGSQSVQQSGSQSVPQSGSQNVPQSGSQNVFNFDLDNNPNPESNSRQVESPLLPGIDSSNSTPSSSAFSVPNTPITEQSGSVYEPLFYPGGINANRQLTCLSIRNPNYENPHPQRHSVNDSAPVLPPKMSADQRRMSSSMVSEMQEELRGSQRTRGLSQLSSSSEPSLNMNLVSSSVTSRRNPFPVSEQTPVGNRTITPPPASIIRTRLAQESPQGVALRNAHLPLDEGPPPYSIASNNSPLRGSQVSSTSADGPSPVDEMGRPLSLREAQVLQLQAEITHKSGVRLVLRKKDSINAIALVECFDSVWVAGWKQKEHPLLHNTFHIGDRIIGIAGHRIRNVQEAYKAIKHQSLIVEFVVRRTPLGKVLAIKREYEGQNLGIFREGGTAEIKEVKQNGLASRHGLPPKASSVDGNNGCNWVLTEINHRPLNLFFKDNEVQDRLNAVGLEISILVQPMDLVKNLKKQLKSLRGYKDYIVQ